MAINIIANNKKAFHDYELIERLECGIVLVGSEVKAIRAGKVNIKESFVKIIKGVEPTLYGMHIGRLSTTQSDFAPVERRARTLLMHKKEAEKWEKRIKLEALTIVPLKIYFNSKNTCKVEIALAKGRKNHDKREHIKEKDDKRKTDRAIKEFNSKFHG
ncbi:MAG: SsrA-binding protein SmpB [Campylobacterales bacterium]|nr:SsrA-binding protein SmpB [Campylobacterales bacterium]